MSGSLLKHADDPRGRFEVDGRKSRMKTALLLAMAIVSLGSVAQDSKGIVTMSITVPEGTPAEASLAIGASFNNLM